MSAVNGGSSAVTLLCVRPPSVGVELDLRVSDVAARFGEAVEVVCVAAEGIPERYKETVTNHANAAQLVALRDGAIVGSAMGNLLPAREIHRVIRCAVEWAEPRSLAL